MKIIKEGKLPITIQKTYRMTCNNCQTEFEYTDEDIIRPRILHDFVSLWPNAIECPFCKKVLSGFIKGDFHIEKEERKD